MMNVPDEVKKLILDQLKLPRLINGIIGPKPGSFVSVRLAGEDKTHLGIYLGDMPIGIVGRVEKASPDCLILAPAQPNPCMYVFETAQLVYGIESWWGEIESEEQLRQITDEDIDHVWYVKALRELQDKAKPEAEVVRVEDEDSDRLRRINARANGGDDMMAVYAAAAVVQSQADSSPDCGPSPSYDSGSSSSCDSGSSSSDSGSSGGGE